MNFLDSPHLLDGCAVPAAGLAPSPTPVADALRAARAEVPLQFQSLPLAGGASVRGGAHAARYAELFGETFLRSESLVAGAAFDSFFFPERCISESERLAAEAFGAARAMFVTTGTTVSNQIAIQALGTRGGRALVDRQCHQSVHFALHARGVALDYLEPVHECPATGRGWWSLDDLLARLRQALADGRGYELLVLNGQSYDGVMFDLGAVVRAIARADLHVPALLVDEAWGSAAYFDETLRDRSAMHGARALAEARGMSLVATHSVHKSMSALRQGSMLLWSGPAELDERLRTARYRLHTTSPSYPILASLDLARAQMCDSGAELTARCRRLAAELEHAVDTDPSLAAYRVQRTPLPPAVAAYAGLDPTKVSIDVSRLGLPATEVKRRLFTDHGLWVNRCTPSAILFNLHIGIDDAALATLLDALRVLQREADRQEDALQPAETAAAFVIAYPPGIPIVAPGEPMTRQAQARIEAARRAGATLFTVAG